MGSKRHTCRTDYQFGVRVVIVENRELPVFLACLLAAAPALAAPVLELPVRCAMGERCVVQNYVDADPGAGARDYRCGFLTYDSHKGTDIRVNDIPSYERGVPVLAAAAGKVRAVRDGMGDIPVSPSRRDSIKGREAGNSVVVQHGDGWETQYAHLRKGSVAVRPGDRVEAGQALGTVGLSGNTEFPHLHFEVRRDGKTVDPFVGVEGGEPCAAGRAPLWSAGTLPVLVYRPTGLLSAGISGARPAMTAATVDEGRTERLGPASPAAVFWVQLYGPRSGDTEELKLLGPDGAVLAEQRRNVERNQAQRLRYIGIRRREGNWPRGAYRGEYRLLRDGGVVLEVRREVTP
jgi:murein DD-endopeptidase MepM/ murein hydrolase activator NlpD